MNTSYQNLRKFINEMAFNDGRRSHASLSREDEYNKIKKEQPIFLKIIHKKINLLGYNLISYSNCYYITDKDDNYLGYIEYKADHKKIYITSSSSNLKGGFYNIIFSAILLYTEIEMIISDGHLSSNAIKAYENLARQNSLKIFLTKDSGETLEEFNPEKIENDNTRVVVAGKYLKEATEKIASYMLETSASKEWLESHKEDIDFYLYGEAINEMEYI